MSAAAPAPSVAVAIRPGDPVRIGVNYIPSKRWWFQWISWNSREIDEDLAAVSALGFDHIRIQCLWPYFQPQRGWINEELIDRLEGLLDIAVRRGLQVEITVLDGWLSGFAFFPPWFRTSGGELNLFRDLLALEAEDRLFRAFAARIAAHPAFLGFDIGNEANVLASFGQSCTVAEGDAWQARLLALCAELAPGRLHVNGVDHWPWFLGKGFSREALAREGGATVIHAYAKWTGAADRYGPCGIGVTRLAELMIEFAAAYADDPNRPVWLQEFGSSEVSMPSALLERYVEETVRAALSSRHCRLITWWGSHDIDPEVFPDFSAGEYRLGLLSTANRVKPVGRLFERLIREIRESPPAPASRHLAVEIPDSLLAYGARDDDASCLDRVWKLGSAFMVLRSEGLTPCFVRERDAADPTYLTSRGIDEIRSIPWARGET